MALILSNVSLLRLVIKMMVFGQLIYDADVVPIIYVQVIRIVWIKLVWLIGFDLRPKFPRACAVSWV